MRANGKKSATVPAQVGSTAAAAARATNITGKRRRAHRRPGLHSFVFAAVVLGSHAGVLYVLAHEVEPVLPSVSVPLMISLATAAEPVKAKPVQVKPKVAPPPKARPEPRPKPISKPKPKLRQEPVIAKAPEPAPLPPPLPEETEPAPVEPPPPQVAAPPVVAPPAPAPPQVVPPQFDAAYLDNPIPAYPPLSRRLGEQGRVMLRVYVAPDGTAHSVEVRQSSGSLRLDRAAKEAVERWKFTPARRGSEPIGAWVVVPVKFSLSSQG